MVNKIYSVGKCSEFTLLNKMFDKIFTFLQKKGRNADRKSTKSSIEKGMEGVLFGTIETIV